MRKVLFTGLFLLCQCATQHEKRQFSPFFRTDPSGYLSAAYVYERAQLEAKPGLSLLEKRRLADLYELELLHLGSQTTRAGTLKNLVENLRQQTQERAVFIEAIKVQNARPVERSEKGVAFTDERLKREYQEIYRLWNQNENQTALIRAIAFTEDEAFLSLTTQEQVRATNLLFQIALDVPHFSAAEAAYARLKKSDECAPATAQAGFLLSMNYLAAGQTDLAWKTFSQQCDRDETVGNLTRRRYWRARLAPDNEGKKLYELLAQSEVPSYYGLLAQRQLQKPLELRHSLKRPSLPLTVSKTIHSLLVEAEKSLESGLRLDAAVLLTQVLRRMGPSASQQDIPLMLYLAHLFQASGVQIESMKLYSRVAELAQSEPEFLFDFSNEMFPKPHQANVKAVSQTFDLDPDFVYAIMRQESAFNSGAVSPVGARGLMQLMPFLGGQLSKIWSYEPYYHSRTLFFAKENLKFAAYHLHQLKGELDHPALMAAAYNAGARRVAEWRKRRPGIALDIFVELIPVNETANYVKLVLRNYVFYKALENPQPLDLSFLSLQLPDSPGSVL